jgi:hypothetical protein
MSAVTNGSRGLGQDVCFTPVNGHRQAGSACPKSADFVAKVGCNGLGRYAFR